MLLRLRIHGKERLERDLKDSGFSSNEANGYIMIAELMAESSEQKRRKTQPSERLGADSDDDSDDDDDFMYGRRDSGRPFDPRRRPVSPTPSQNAQGTSSSSSSSNLAPGSWAAEQLSGLPSGHRCDSSTPTSEA
jgi:hypothetical protein